MELYRKYRPKTFKDIVGQDDVVSSLVQMGKRKEIPHFLLFTGPSGCGKTTIARILRVKLKCADADFAEVNAANHRGIDLVRGINQVVGLKPMAGQCRVWLIDEAHQLTSEAQGAFLKILEDTPLHAYFMLCTTDPQKLKPTVRTRATEYALKEISESKLSSLVGLVASSEGLSLSEDVIDRIARVADGSARKALVLLHSIMGLDDENSQLETIKKGYYEESAIEIARGLLGGMSWSEMVKILQGVDGDAEQLRRMVLGYCRRVMLSNNKLSGRAAVIIDMFQDNLYDSGRAGFDWICRALLLGDTN